MPDVVTLARTARESLAHLLGVRGDFRTLADQGDVGVDQAPTPRGDPAGGMGQEMRAVPIFPRRLTGREMAADIALGQRAIDRVAQRVDPNIGIRMTRQTLVVRHGDTAQHHRPIIGQHVHVEAGADMRKKRPGRGHGGL